MIGWGILLLFLLVCSAFFSGIETAFTATSLFKVKHLVSQNAQNAKLLLKLKNKASDVLTAVLIGNNLVNILAASTATFIALKIFGKYGVSIATGIMTLFILIFGEITPKNYCAVHSQKVAIKTAKILNFLTIILFPFVKALQFITKLFIGEHIIFKRVIFTEDELKTVIKLGAEEGTIDTEEKEMIHSVLELDKTRVKEILIPRTDMFALEYNNILKNVIDEILDTGFSRIPVYDEQIDSIKGIIFVKDLIEHILKSKLDIQLKQVMRPAKFVPENMNLFDLLTTFRDENIHIALVVNEHGGIEGLVTIEDVLEELVGEIYDETDEPEKLIKEIKQNIFKILGKTPIDEINENLNLTIERTETYDTISGLILEQIGRIPEEGEVLNFEDFDIKILKVQDNRINEIELTKKILDPPEEQQRED